MPDVKQGHDRLASAQEVSDYLGVETKTLYNWKGRKPVPFGPTAIKVGHQLRYKWSEVERWLAERSANSAA